MPFAADLRQQNFAALRIVLEAPCLFLVLTIPFLATVVGALPVLGVAPFVVIAQGQCRRSASNRSKNAEASRTEKPKQSVDKNATKLTKLAS